MNDFLLLKDSQQCPNCRCKGRVRHMGPCPNCGITLFTKPIDFKFYEDCGEIRHYWMFHPENGWMHRDQIMCRLEAQERFPNIVTPEPNRSTTPEQVAKRGGRTVRELVGRK